MLIRYWNAPVTAPMANLPPPTMEATTHNRLYDRAADALADIVFRVSERERCRAGGRARPQHLPEIPA
jgi:hypothetical protein